MRLYDKRRWKDRWALRLGHWYYIARHPLIYFWWQDLKDDDEFRHTAQFKRPICWVLGHDWIEVAGDEYWMNSSVVGTYYYSVCVRCFWT